MQTFLPFPDFTLSAKCLDDSLLVKQVAEVLTVYKILKYHKHGWDEYPVCKMWYGHLGVLGWYYTVLHSVAKAQNLTMLPIKGVELPEMLVMGSPVIFPSWIGSPALHRSHQSNLLKRNEKHYRFWFGTTVPKNLDYHWPVR